MKLKLLPLLLALLLLLLAACEPVEAPALPGTASSGGDSSSTLPATDGDASADTDPPEVNLHPDGSDHSDADGDERCDRCAISVVVALDFYALNDLHGKLCDTDSQPGVDELTTYLKAVRETDDYTVLLSSGDMWQGSSESNLTEGLILTDWMNQLGFAAMTLGNHEYDWGEDAIRANHALAEFPLLAINVYDRATGARADYCEASVLVERGPVTVGIIGAIGDCYSSISGEMSGGFTIKTGRELTALVEAEAARLREAGAELIIYSLHDGYDDSRTGGLLTDSQLAPYYDPALSEEGTVDLVFEAHTHQRYVLRDDEGIYHLQGGGENRGLSHVELRYNFVTDEWRVSTAEIIPSSVYGRMEDDPIVDELMDKYADRVSAGTEVLGRNAKKRSSDELCDLIAALYAEVGVEAFGEQYDIVLGGGFLSARSPYDLAAGEVRYSDLQAIFPFDNTLVLCSISGADLERVFIHTDNDRYHMAYTPYGESVKGDIDPTATYYVLVDSYTSTYKPNRLTEIARYTEGVYARDLLSEYIKDGGMEK